LNTNKSKFFHYINIILAVFTGILAFGLTCDLIIIMTRTEPYSIIHEGSRFGCNYQSLENYKIFSISGSASMIIAFISGFFFKDELKAIFARLFFVIAAYAIKFILNTTLCP